MMYYKLDWPRYEKAIDLASELNIIKDDFYWCENCACGFISERIYERIKAYI